MDRRLVPLGALVVGLAGIAGAGFALAADDGRPYRAYAPIVSRADLPPTATPTPTPRPTPYIGPVRSLYLGSARIGSSSPVEQGDTYFTGGREFFEDPSAPHYIIYYPRFGIPGFGGGHTVFAAHVNYVGYGNGPFAYLLDAKAGDALYVTMGDGTEYAYTVKSIELKRLAELDMDAVVFPPLDGQTERVTLISCGGTFIPAASGYGGEYDSRIILVAERYVP